MADLKPAAFASVEGSRPTAARKDTKGKFVGLVYKARVGEDHQNAVLSDAQVEAMRDRYEAGVDGTGPRIGYKALAREFEVPKRTVRDIVNYRRRAAYPDRWKRVDNQ